MANFTEQQTATMLALAKKSTKTGEYFDAFSQRIVKEHAALFPTIDVVEKCFASVLATRKNSKANAKKAGLSTAFWETEILSLTFRKNPSTNTRGRKGMTPFEREIAAQNRILYQQKLAEEISAKLDAEATAANNTAIVNAVNSSPEFAPPTDAIASPVNL